MKPSLPPSQLAAWRGFYGAYWRVSSRIEADLNAAGLPSLSWYDVLYELYQATDHHLRMCELAARTQLSRSGLTRLADRLEKAGLILRRGCPADGRVLHAELTASGIEMLRKIWPVYRAGIQAHFAGTLDDDELGQLASLAGRLSPVVQEEPATA